MFEIALKEFIFDHLSVFKLLSHLIGGFFLPYHSIVSHLVSCINESLLIFHEQIETGAIYIRLN